MDGHTSRRGWRRTSRPRLSEGSSRCRPTSIARQRGTRRRRMRRSITWCARPASPVVLRSSGSPADPCAPLSHPGQVLRCDSPDPSPILTLAMLNLSIPETERKKLLRRLQPRLKTLASSPPTEPKALSALNTEILNLRIGLNYVLVRPFPLSIPRSYTPAPADVPLLDLARQSFPNSRKYISLFPPSSKPAKKGGDAEGEGEEEEDDGKGMPVVRKSKAGADETDKARSELVEEVRRLMDEGKSVPFLPSSFSRLPPAFCSRSWTGAALWSSRRSPSQSAAHVTSCHWPHSGRSSSSPRDQHHSDLLAPFLCPSRPIRCNLPAARPLTSLQTADAPRPFPLPLLPLVPGCQRRPRRPSARTGPSSAPPPRRSLTRRPPAARAARRQLAVAARWRRRRWRATTSSAAGTATAIEWSSSWHGRGEEPSAMVLPAPGERRVGARACSGLPHGSPRHARSLYLSVHMQAADHLALLLVLVGEGYHTMPGAGRHVTHDAKERGTRLAWPTVSLSRAQGVFADRNTP